MIGSDESMQIFQQRMASEHLQLPMASSKLQLQRLLVRTGNPFIGMSIKDSGIRSHHHCMVVGFEDNQGNIVPTTATHVIDRNDAMWIVGEDDSIRLLKKAFETKVS